MQPEIVNKIENLNHLFNQKTHLDVNYERYDLFSKCYLSNAYQYLTKTLRFDFAGVRKLESAKNLNEYSKFYEQLFSLKKCILSGIGVCNQFTNFLCILIANNKCAINKMRLDKVKISNLICNKKSSNGEIKHHSINLINIYDKELFCDVTLGSRLAKRQLSSSPFFLVSEEQLQAAYSNFDGSRLVGSADQIEVKENSIETIYNLLEKNEYYENVNNETYKASKYIIK